MSSDSNSNREEHPRREIHFNITTAQSNGKVSEANYDSPDEAQEKPIIQQKKVIKLRGESAKVPQQSPLLRNNYLLAQDNNEPRSRRPPITKSAKSKDFPMSASTFFNKSPSGLTLGDKGFGFDTKGKNLKKQRKLGLTQHTSNAFGMRSQSEKDMNRIRSGQRDPQDIAHNLHLLKIQYNNIAEENTRLKTRNKNLEAVINTLYSDLNNQQIEIQKIFQGKQITPSVLLTGSQLGLKRQLREERLINKNLNDDLENLKKSLKATSAQEQAQQIQFYLEECVRLRSMLELEIRQNKQTALTMIEDNANLLTATTEEERKRILSELERQNQELKIAHKLNKQLSDELDQARLKRHEAEKYKQMGDLKTRQAFLIKAKGQQIKTLEEQLQIFKTKCENYERRVSANNDMSKQFNELNQKLAQRNAEIKTLKESLLNVSSTQKLPKVEASPQKTRSSPVAGFALRPARPRLSHLHTTANQQDKISSNEEGNQFLNVQIKPYSRQMSVPLEQRKLAQQARPKDDFGQNSSKPSLHMDTSPVQNLSSRPQSDSTQFFKKTNLSKSELVIRGLNNFKALAEKKEQPNNDIDQAFYKTYSKDIQQLYRKMQHLTLPVPIIKKLLEQRMLLPQGLDLQETVRLCVEKFSVFANELQVCEIILNHFIPCISADNFELQKFYTRLEILLNTHSDNSMQSHEIDRSIQEEQFIESEFQDEDERAAPFRSSLEPGKIQMFDSQNKPVTVQVLSLQDDFNPQTIHQQKNMLANNAINFDQNYQTTQKNGLQSPQPHLPVESGESSEYSQPLETENESMSAHSGNMIDYIENVNNSITEEQMLDTAEQILNTLANKLIENGWTVHDVFGQPEEIVKIIPEYENQRNIKVISASNFLGRVYQVGIQNLTQLQVACLMRVLGKPEFDDSVRYDELELLLENFGVTKDQLSIMPDDNQDAQQFEEEKVQVQEVLAGSPVNDCEVSEEVVFIDDTKPLLEFQNQFEDQKQRNNVPELQGTNFQAKPVLQQAHDQKLGGQKLKVPRLKAQPGFDSPKNVETEESQSIQHKIYKSSQLNHLTSTNSVNPDRPKPTAGLDKNPHSRSDSAYGNTPTFVHQSAGQKSSGVSTHKSNQRVILADFDEKDKNFTNPYYSTELKVETEQPPEPLQESQNQAVVEQKESRLQVSKQTLSKRQNEKLGQFFSDVLGKISCAELLVQVEKNGYKQQIKSKTTFTETSVITLDVLLAILEPYSKLRLSQEDIKALQECVQLTPKFSKIIAVKHFATFLKEVQEINQNHSRRGEQNPPQIGRLDRLMDF